MSHQMNTIVSLLRAMRLSNEEDIPLFKTVYLKYFDPNTTPPRNIQAGAIVTVNRQQAIQYLQTKYNLIPTTELCHLPSKK